MIEEILHRKIYAGFSSDIFVTSYQVKRRHDSQDYHHRKISNLTRENNFNFPYEGTFFYVVTLNFLLCVCVCVRVYVCVRNLIFSASQNFHTKVFVLCK